MRFDLESFSRDHLLKYANVLQMMDNARPFLMGKVAAVVNEKKSAREIVDELVSGAVYAINTGSGQIVSKAKL